MKNNPVGLAFTIDNEPHSIYYRDRVILKNGMVSKDYINTVLALENGQKIEGYVKIISEEGKAPYHELYPKEFKKTLALLSVLGVNSTLIDEAPKKKTKGKFIIVNLTKEQEDELNRLKALCNK